MKKITPILNRMKQVLNVKTDKELTKKLEMSYSTLDTWKNRDRIPEKRLLEFSLKYQVPMNWLLTGEGEMYKENVKTTIKNKYCDEICDNFQKLPEDKQKYYYHKIMTDIYETLQNG